MRFFCFSYFIQSLPKKQQQSDETHWNEINDDLIDHWQNESFNVENDEPHENVICSSSSLSAYQLSDAVDQFVEWIGLWYRSIINEFVV